MDDYTNWVLAVSIVINFVLIVLSFRFRTILGAKYFSSVFKAATWRFKQPIEVILFYGNSKYWQKEIRDSSTNVQFDNQAGNIPITMNDSKRYNSEGAFKSYFFRDDLTENFEPTETNPFLHEILRRLGLVNNRYNDYKEMRIRAQYSSQLLLKSHFNMVAILLGIGIIATLYLTFNLTQFADSAVKIYAEWIPIIQEQVANVPKLVPGNAGGGGIDPGKLLQGLNGGSP